ncbi:hypothetical protein MPH_09304 [Macrophomina phaseolina MS6]|uniref:Uncharacterized protein n=2 Tax=Macrophomina phaseolina TaxID=35725 RepID=K2S9J0_MACPH|nr:hypothetical protein MPH_09304 [Macrophomina phaseolina MS6]KAH7043322.1 hypothetical protein B0J12DRAFT_742940 [Macrophomina phaseolina]
MLSNIVLPLLLAGAVSAADQSVLSFAFPGDGYYTQVPTSGISGSLIGVEGGRTTLAYTCPEAATALDDYESKVGVLCPLGTNAPQTVTYGDDFYGVSTSTVVNAITAAFVEDCEITATPASGGAASATASPTCTFSFGGEYADELVAVLTCADPSVIGTDAEDPNTASYLSCISSATATPTDVMTTTWSPDNVWYWSVTVTATASGVSIPAETGAAASSTGGSTGAASVHAVSRVAVAGVVGLAAVILAL